MAQPTKPAAAAPPAPPPAAAAEPELRAVKVRALHGMSRVRANLWIPERGWLEARVTPAQLAELERDTALDVAYPGKPPRPDADASPYMAREAHDAIVNDLHAQILAVSSAHARALAAAKAEAAAALERLRQEHAAELAQLERELADARKAR